MVLVRPAQFNGALVDPKRSLFDRMHYTVRVEQEASSAVP